MKARKADVINLENERLRLKLLKIKGYIKSDVLIQSKARIPPIFKASNSNESQSVENEKKQ